MTMKNKRVLFVITEDWALISHRLHLVDAAIKAGFEVGLLTRINSHYDILKARNINIFEWKLVRRSLNPVHEILAIISLFKAIWLFRPDIIHAVALKPVIYTGVVRFFFFKTGFIAALGGLGFIFNSKSLKARLLKPITRTFLKYALLKQRTRLILQNKDNIDTIKSMNIIDTKNLRLIKGAGVEVKKFVPTPIPKGIPIITLPGRMLSDKGVFEFAKVAERIKFKNIKARFILAGDIDLQNPASIPQAHIDKWVTDGIIEHWKRCDDIKEVYYKTSIVCLPSYNEGLPKVLIEAGSCSRPVVAFDVPGCREVVRNNINGFLVEFGNEYALEKALVDLIKDKQLCKRMGERGRKIVEKEFSDIVINNETFNVWNEIL